MLTIISPAGKPAPPETLACKVAIVGGGFSGASIARFLALDGNLGEGGIVVFEPRPHLGTGLAYGTTEPHFRLNVTAQRMRAIPDDPLAFLAFLKRSGRLEADPDAVRGETIYARRADFGAFMQAQMQPFLADGRVLHVRAPVTDILRSNGKWRVRSANGLHCLADNLVISTGHPQPDIPAALAETLSGHPHFITNPETAFTALHPDSQVLIIGAGLTALDVVTKLEGEGHRGSITLLCRSGLLPRTQLTFGTEPYGDFVTGQPHTARTLLIATRQALKAAEQDGRPWQSVFDALRQQGQMLWQDLPFAERQRFLRHLRRRFETHRHRMPPQNAEMVERLMGEGRLDVETGQISTARVEGGDTVLDIARQRIPPLQRRYGLVVLATGADHASALQSQPWLASLCSHGILSKDKTGLGIACDRESRALSVDAAPDDTLFIAGPLARGQFGELTGVPEIALQAQAIARHILSQTEDTGIKGDRQDVAGRSV